jgi:hypothetical protein
MRRKFILGMLTAALLPLGLGNANARTFSDASLKGTCIWQSVAFPTSSGDQVAAGPTSILASVTFDGHGALTLDFDVNINGSYTSTDAVSGFYSVDSKGHGSFTFTSPPSGNTLTYDFRISSTGHTIYTMVQSYGGKTLTPRISYGSCSFQEPRVGPEQDRRD